MGAHSWVGESSEGLFLEFMVTERHVWQGMQFYNFIFLSRSWASDRFHLANSLAWLGQCAEKAETPLTFILYPEGTLVSKDTRPVSKKFADKMGIVRNLFCAFREVLLTTSGSTAGHAACPFAQVYWAPLLITLSRASHS